MYFALIFWYLENEATTYGFLFIFKCIDSNFICTHTHTHTHTKNNNNHRKGELGTSGFKVQCKAKRRNFVCIHFFGNYDLDRDPQSYRVSNIYFESEESSWSKWFVLCDGYLVILYFIFTYPIWLIVSTQTIENPIEE